MPRPVVPIARLPRKRSVTLSSVWWYGATRCAFALIRSREVSTPRLVSMAISSNSAARFTTTPLPITGVTCGERIPAGRSLSSNFSPSTTTVCPALLPPLGLTT